MSQLEPVSTSQIPNYTNPSPLLIKVNWNLEFEVTQVLDSKLDKYRKDPLLYFIYWAGYKGTAEEFSWLTASDLENTTKLVANFHSHNLGKPGPHLTATTTLSHMADNVW